MVEGFSSISIYEDEIVVVVSGDILISEKFITTPRNKSMFTLLCAVPVVIPSRISFYTDCIRIEPLGMYGVTEYKCYPYPYQTIEA